MARRCCRRMVGLGANRTSLRAASSATSCARWRPPNCRSRLDQRFEEGGLEEASLRALIYVRLPEGAFDERSFVCSRASASRATSTTGITRSQFKDMLNEQLQLVTLDEERAIDALPKLVQGRGGRHRARGARCAADRGARRAGRRASAGSAGSRSCSAQDAKPRRSRKAGNV